MSLAVVLPRDRYGSMVDFSRIAVVGRYLMYTTSFTLQGDRNYIYIFFFTELAAARELHIALL